MAEEIESRLLNWSNAWRRRMKLDQAESAEGVFRSPQSKHWHWHEIFGCAPINRAPIDWPDADLIENSVCAIDLFHHTLLKLAYIRRWHPMTCLKEAHKAGGTEMPTHKGYDYESSCESSLAMAKALLQTALTQPAVIRKERAREYVRRVLGTGGNILAFAAD